MTLSGGGAPHSAEVLGGVGVADERRVVAPDDRAVQRGPDALVGLRAGDDQPPHLALGEHDLEVGLLEGVGVPLVHHRLGRRPGSARGRTATRRSPWASRRSECCTHTTGTSSARALSTRVTMLAMTPSRLWVPADDVVLDVDHEQRGPRSVGQCRHEARLGEDTDSSQVRRERPPTAAVPSSAVRPVGSAP